MDALAPRIDLEAFRALADPETIALLRTWLPSLQLPTPLPGRSRPDDCLDAVACAWSGTRWLTGEAEVLGDETDTEGLPMRIVV